MKVKSDDCYQFSNLSNWKEEAWKYQSFKVIRTRDLRDTSAMLDQLGCEATRWEWYQFDDFTIFPYSEMMWNICEIHICTAVVAESEEWPSQ